MLGRLSALLAPCAPSNCASPLAHPWQMALWLAFFNQAFASTSIISYAPQVRCALCAVCVCKRGLCVGGWHVECMQANP